jgi:hypothetical protein
VSDRSAVSLGGGQQLGPHPLSAHLSSVDGCPADDGEDEARTKLAAVEALITVQRRVRDGDGIVHVHELDVALGREPGQPKETDA